MKSRYQSFVVLSCSLALTCSCSCASTPVPPKSTETAWTKVAPGHYQSVATKPVASETGTGALLRGDNAAEKTYGVFVGAIQATALVGLCATSLAVLPFVGGGYGGGGCQ